jgi:8-oxo-dGTP pyrophosphatase MutT (NUDIX family)
MPPEHRIAAGGIVIEGGRILLVRYRRGGGTYLVAPGGAIEDGESLASAAEREVDEETGVKCRATAPAVIENIRATRYQMVKVWYVCDYLGGDAYRTAGADREGIIEVGWYADDELRGETVFPAVIRAMGIASLGNVRPGVIDTGVSYAHF